MQNDEPQLNEQTMAQFVSLGHSKSRILATFQEVQMRMEWKVGSECFVFGRSTGKWTEGYIESVTVDETANTEWLRVQYGANKKKRIQRFSDCIKPRQLGVEHVVDGDLLKQIAEKLRAEKNNDTDSVEQNAISSDQQQQELHFQFEAPLIIGYDPSNQQVSCKFS